MEQRRAYARAWRAANPAYDIEYRRRNRVRLSAQHRAWRAGHPELVAAARKREVRPSRALAPIPALHTGHDVFDHAGRFLTTVGQHPDRRRSVYDPFYEDLMSEAVLAILEGRSLIRAVNAARRSEYEFRDNCLTGSWNVAVRTAFGENSVD